MTILKHLKGIGLGLLLPIFISSCAYRFSNTAIKNPLGIQTLAVEAIYDESREVIPHEFLWSALQREVIRNARVTLTNQEEADALMVVTIKNAQVNPRGTPSQEANSKDPPNSDTDKGSPDRYRNLKRAGTWTTEEGIRLNVHVEVYDLKSRAVLFRKDYAQSGSFRSLRPVTITPSSSSYLHYDEALRARFRTMAETLAGNIVHDFLM